MGQIVGAAPKMKNTRLRSILLGVCLAFTVGCSVTPQPWESAVQQFEAQDKLSSPPTGATLFVGSSSFTLWASLQADFFPHPVINRGFGGAQTSDLLTHMDRIILPYAPANIIFYCGGNDLATGTGSAALTAELKTFTQRVHAQLPDTNIYILSVKPSPLRMKLWPKMQVVNAARQQFARQAERVFYIDVSQDMFAEDGSLRTDIFLEDNLHMSQSGYALWTKRIKAHLEWNNDAGNSGLVK